MDRTPNNIATDIRGILLGIQELKQKQFVGTDQIIIQKTETETIHLPVSVNGYNFVRITATGDIGAGNAMIAHLVPEIRNSNGDLIEVSGDIYPNYSVRSYRADGKLFKDDINIQRWEISINASTAQTLTIKAYIYASCPVTLEVAKSA